MYAGLKSDQDNQDAFMSNYFPVRNTMRLHHKKSRESGSWVMVYRNKQKRQLKAVLSSKSKTFEDVKVQREVAEAHGVPINKVKVIKENVTSTSARIQLGKILSYDWILRHLKLNSPQDATVLRIDSCDLSVLDDRDLEEFYNVIHVKASENLLPLDSFVKFKNIENLEMQMNCIGTASNVSTSLLVNENASVFNGDIYPNLKILNLDYNDLNAVDFDALSYLPKLETLSVVGNRLCSLPPPDYQRIEANLFFPCVVNLDMSENAISEEADFLYLCGMPKLQMLSLSENSVLKIPSINFTGHRFAIVPLRHNFNSETDAPIVNNSAGVNEESGDDSARALSTIAETTSERSSPALLLLPPFPELSTIDLSDNKISSDLDLAGILSWPSLKKVIVDGNPLAERDRRILQKKKKYFTKKAASLGHYSSADKTSSICEFMEQSLGVDVVRSKVRPVENRSVSAPSVIKRFPNLEAKIPKVPRCDVDKLLALCPPPILEQFSDSAQPTEAIPSKSPTEPEDSVDKWQDDDETTADNIQFFMTELDPELDTEELKANYQDAFGIAQNTTATNKNTKSLVAYDARYKGFEELFTEDKHFQEGQESDDYLNVPTNLKESVHTLRNMLELPTISRRPAAAIEAWANRRMEAKRRTSETSLDFSSASGREPIPYEPYVSKIHHLGAPVVRTYGGVVEEIVSNQKEREPIAEAALGSILKDGPARHPKQYKNARKLLRQITTQYDELRKNLEDVIGDNSRETKL